MATYRSRGGVNWANVDRAITPPTHRIVDRTYAQARQNLSRHVRTGRLIGTLRTRKRVASGQVLIGSDHWKFIEYGTGAHEIEPVNRRALAWPAARHPVRRVRHPGTREYAPMRRALYAQRGR
jgi:hypothetical protein